MIKFNLLKFRLFGMFIIKKCVEFSLISFRIAKKDFTVKTREMFSFLPLMNYLVTTGLLLSFLLLSISAIISSKTINVLCVLPGFYSSIFFKYRPYHMSIQ